MARILVIDDDENSLKTVSAALKHEGYETLEARDGREGLKVAFNGHPDLVILDVMLPGIDGTEVCRRLQELADIPIIMLSALSSENDVVKGLVVGADDYITKPYSLAELSVRVRNVLRRHTAPSPQSKASVLTVGPLVIDLARHKVTAHSEPVDLTPTEFRLLSYLARNPGTVIPHRTLLHEVWGPEYGDQVDYLHLYIRYLRQRVERDPSKPEIIKTEWGVGYYVEG